MTTSETATISHPAGNGQFQAWLKGLELREWQTYLEDAESSGATGEAAREAFMEAGLRHPFAPDCKVLESARVILNFSG